MLFGGAHPDDKVRISCRGLPPEDRSAAHVMAGSVLLPDWSGYPGVHSVVIQWSVNLFCALFSKYAQFSMKKGGNKPTQVAVTGTGVPSGMWVVPHTQPGSQLSVPWPPLDMKVYLPFSRATLERLGFQTQLGAWPLVQRKCTWTFQVPVRSALWTS